MDRRSHFWLLSIILLAFALRWHNLTYHSLWFDEAISVHWARQSVPRILEVSFTLVEDRLPPLYYLLLKGWTTLVGFSESGVRSLSVFLGTLLVPVTAVVTQRLFNHRVALLTALLITLNPFLIWYAQEARMYAPAILFSVLTVWAFLKMVTTANKRMANGRTANEQANHSHSLFTIHYSLFTILLILFALAGLYSHLYAGFLLPALGLWLIVSYPRAWKLWLRFALSGLIIILAYIPILKAIWSFSGEAAPGDPLSGFGQRAWWLLHAFTLWKAPLSPFLQTAIPTIILLLALCAYLKPKRQQSLISNLQSPNLPISPPPNLPSFHSSIFHPLLLTTLLLTTPFLIATLLLLRNHLAFFGERYFIVMVPWLLLLVAAGINNLSRLISRITPKKISTHYALRSTFYVLRLMPLLLILIITLLPLPSQWSIPAAKEAWRQSVAYLADHAQAEDGILIHPDWVRYPFQFYFQGPGQTYAAFSDVTPETPLDDPLQGVVSDHPVIWLIQSHVDSPDPNRLVEQWFASRYPLVTELYPPGIALKGYAPGYQLDALPPQTTPVDLRFENGLRVVGYTADPVASAADDLFHPPSGWVHATLYWSAAEPIAQDVAPFVHLIGPEGVWGVNLERANDALRLYPPSRWAAGTIIRHDVDVNLNPATPPGRYPLVVGFQESSEQQPLTTVEVR